MTPDGKRSGHSAPPRNAGYRPERPTTTSCERNRPDGKVDLPEAPDWANVDAATRLDMPYK